MFDVFNILCRQNLVAKFVGLLVFKIADQKIRPEYRTAGFRPGLDLSNRYELPPMKFPRYHVRVRFPQPVRGPLAIGAGRYRGLGLFAAE